MGFEKINIFDKKIGNLILYFLITFVILSIFAMIISKLLLGDMFVNFIKNQGIDYFHDNINTNFELKREVQIQKDIENKDEIILTTVFYDKPDHSGNFPAKNIKINLIYEGLLPILLVMILILSTPISWQRRLISLLIGTVLMILYIYFKLYAFAYDNYSEPDYALKKLPIIVDQLVYFYNMIVSISGYSLNLIVSLIIWLVSVVRKQDLELIENLS